MKMEKKLPEELSTNQEKLKYCKNCLEIYEKIGYYQDAIRNGEKVLEII